MSLDSFSCSLVVFSIIVVLVYLVFSLISTVTGASDLVSDVVVEESGFISSSLLEVNNCNAVAGDVLDVDCGRIRQRLASGLE